MPPEHPEAGGETSEAEEVLSYWFPEDLVNADLEDEKALRQALEGIDSGMDRELTPVEGNVFWPPLGRSEDPT
jgi:hypothetical protein